MHLYLLHHTIKIQLNTFHESINANLPYPVSHHMSISSDTKLPFNLFFLVYCYVYFYYFIPCPRPVHSRTIHENTYIQTKISCINKPKVIIEHHLLLFQFSSHIPTTFILSTYNKLQTTYKQLNKHRNTHNLSP